MGPRKWIVSWQQLLILATSGWVPCCDISETPLLLVIGKEKRLLTVEVATKGCSGKSFSWKEVQKVPSPTAFQLD